MVPCSLSFLVHHTHIVHSDKVANVLLAYKANGFRSPAMQAAQEIARSVAIVCMMGAYMVK